jgi:hypothetical protein
MVSTGTGRRGLGQVARGKQWRPKPLASGDIPFPHLWIVDAQMALFREQLAKILEKCLVKIWGRGCEGAGI